MQARQSCDYNWNPANDGEIATFCFFPYLQCLKKKPWNVHTTIIVQLNKPSQSEEQCNLIQLKKNIAAP